MLKVSFEMESVTVEVPAGSTLLDAAHKAGIVLQRGFAEAHPCGGRGACSGPGCAVYLRTDKSAVSPPTWKERLFYRRILRNNRRLACQAKPLRDVTLVTLA